ncbi:MAG: hypothetical protein FWG51_05880 [Firmicutes bacterium]|nr:hypothetical protein [Bacillota bacterium]
MKINKLKNKKDKKVIKLKIKAGRMCQSGNRWLDSMRSVFLYVTEQALHA